MLKPTAAARVCGLRMAKQCLAGTHALAREKSEFRGRRHRRGEAAPPEVTRGGSDNTTISSLMIARNLWLERWSTHMDGNAAVEHDKTVAPDARRHRHHPLV